MGVKLVPALECPTAPADRGAEELVAKDPTNTNAPASAKRPRSNREKVPRGKPAAPKSPTQITLPEPAGLAARRLAVELIEAVLISGRSMDDALDTAGRAPGLANLDPRDRGFARLIAATVLRRLGSLDAVLTRFLERPLPSTARRAGLILLTGAAQILMLGTPAHAAINLAVEQCRRDPKANRFDKLTNAVLRKVAATGPEVLAAVDTPRVDIPDWIWDRWTTAYGEDRARLIAAASLIEAPLDISVKSDVEGWAAKLGGRAIGPASVRLGEHGRVEDLPGYGEGAWWVQDFAAGLPARLLGDVRGLDVADLCAAPGGKSAALAIAGAMVTAVDISSLRLERLQINMARLGLSDRVQPVSANIEKWVPGRLFDAVLLDAPCTATGTIRRHPDILHLKRPGDAGRLAALQTTLIERASLLVKHGGQLIYCVCSLETEEGPAIVEGFLANHPDWIRRAIVPQEVGADPSWITPLGDLRTLPCFQPGPADTSGGMDGFYAARLERRKG